jgi:hypothetical protein
MIRRAKSEPLSPRFTRLGYWLFFFVTLATAHLSARLAGGVVVSLLYGPRAYLEGDVCVADWKKGLLSNGEHLTPTWHNALALITFIIWSLCVTGFVMGAGRIRFLTRRPDKEAHLDDEFVS